MPDKPIYINGVGTVRFPDSMSDEQIASTIRDKIIPQRNAQQREGSSTFGQTFAREMARKGLSGVAVREAERRIGQIFSPVGEAASTIGKGISQLPLNPYMPSPQTNPVAGLANIAAGGIGLAASPFTVAEQSVRQIPGGEQVADAATLPFRAVGEGVAAIAPPGEGETSQALHGLNQALAQVLLGAGVAKGVKTTPPKTTRLVPPERIDAPKMPELNLKNTGDLPALEILPQTFKAELIKKLGPETQTRFGKVKSLSEPDLIKVAEELGVMTSPKIGEIGPITKGGKPVTPPLETKPTGETVVKPQEQPNAILGKVIDAIEQAKPIRGDTEVLYRAERSKRAGKLASVFSDPRGEATLRRALSTQKGPLPKAEFEPIRNKVTQADLDWMHNEVVTSSKIDIYEKLVGEVALDKLFTKEGASVPTRGELVILERVFGKQFAESILKKRGVWDKIKEYAVDASNAPKTVLASADMSMPLRQTVIQVARHPILGVKAMKQMHRSFFSEKAFAESMREIHARPNAKLYKESGLDILDPRDVSTRLVKREEQFTSRLAEKIPIIGRVVHMSSRAAHMMTNRVRADVFDLYAKSLQRQGITPGANPSHYKAAAKWINISTGRGDLGRFTQYAPALGAALFSPRLVAARFQSLNPMTYLKLPKEVAIKAWGDMATFVAATTAMLTMAKMAGLVEVEVDPRSSDFGKMKIGNTRIDPWGGHVQVARFLAQVTSGERKTLGTGEIVKMDNSSPYSGSRLGTIGRFSRSKLSPHVGYLVDWLANENFLGEEFNPGREAIEKMIPLYIQDAMDAVEQEGLAKGLLLSAPAFYGMGVTSFPDKTGVGRAPSVPRPKQTQVPKPGDRR